MKTVEKMVGRFSEASKQGFQRRFNNSAKKLVFKPSPEKKNVLAKKQFSWQRIMPKSFKNQVKIMKIITIWVLVARHRLIFGVNEAGRHWDAF